jgi:putative transposase
MVHLQQNAQAYVPRHELKKEVAADIRAIFNAPNRPEAERLLQQTVTKYQSSASRLASWMEQALPEGFTVFARPAAHRRLLRTSNGVERLNQEIRRRTRVVGIFPNPAACLRLISAILMEKDEEWLAGRAYLSFTD